MRLDNAIGAALTRAALPDTPLNRFTVRELAAAPADPAALESAARKLADTEGRIKTLRGEINSVRGNSLRVMELLTQIEKVRSDLKTAPDPVTREREPSIYDMQSAESFFRSYLTTQNNRFCALLLERNGVWQQIERVADRNIDLPRDGRVVSRVKPDGTGSITAKRAGIEVTLDGSAPFFHLTTDGPRMLLVPKSPDAPVPELLFGNNVGNPEACALLAEAVLALAGTPKGDALAAEVAAFRRREITRIVRYFAATGAVERLQALADRVTTEGELTAGDSDYTVKFGRPKANGGRGALLLQNHASGVDYIVDKRALAAGDLKVTISDGVQHWGFDIGSNGAARNLDAVLPYTFAFAVEYLDSNAYPA